MRFHVAIIVLINTVCHGLWCRAEEEPPQHLTQLAAQLESAAGRAQIARVGRQEWELTVDFPARIDDARLKLLQGHRGVVAIRILKGGVTDKGLSHLKDLPDLRLLVIDSKDMTDEGLAAIGTLKSLTKLDLIHARLTGKGLAALAPLSNLKELYLYGADLCDDDVEPLKKMEHLGWLYLPSTVTVETQKKLEHALPKTQVLRNEEK